MVHILLVFYLYQILSYQYHHNLILFNQSKMKATIFIVTLLALAALAQGAWTNSHEITGDAKTQLQAAIKAKMYL